MILDCDVLEGYLSSLKRDLARKEQLTRTYKLLIQDGITEDVRWDGNAFQLRAGSYGELEVLQEQLSPTFGPFIFVASCYGDSVCLAYRNDEMGFILIFFCTKETLPEEFTLEEQTVTIINIIRRESDAQS